MGFTLCYLLSVDDLCIMTAEQKKFPDQTLKTFGLILACLHLNHDVVLIQSRQKNSYLRHTIYSLEDVARIRHHVLPGDNKDGRGWEVRCRGAGAALHIFWCPVEPFRLVSIHTTHKILLNPKTVTSKCKVHRKTQDLIKTKDKIIAINYKIINILLILINNIKQRRCWHKTCKKTVWNQHECLMHQ